MSTSSINREAETYLEGRGEFKHAHAKLYSEAAAGIEGEKDGGKRIVRSPGGGYEKVDSLRPRSEDVDKLYDMAYLDGHNEAIKIAGKGTAAGHSLLKMWGSAGAGLLIGGGAMALYNQSSTHTTSQGNA